MYITLIFVVRGFLDDHNSVDIKLLGMRLSTVLLKNDFYGYFKKRIT